MTLTREEIQGMKPGKKLNELVMHHIFKMKKEPVGESFTWVYEVDEKIMDWRPHYFNPSADISAAWEVLEKPEIMDRHQIGVYPTSFGTWIARPYMPGGKDCTVQAKTAQEAICKCVLLAVLGL
ncbi:hypothetical protein [Paenibacillus odorifer]|uniref:BC1872 family protein n=1 Tax=Paenibacillus TaxID=44249 RepID=UPI00096DFAEC|nr:hypothetical protein [Paenibacillus odorifer]OMD00883.1 hypothetical protein BJP46_18820 [Paenibacillus odorifer]